MSNLRISSIFLCVLISVIKQTQSGQCVYHPQNFSVTARNPTNPITNCLKYCTQYYAETPQRTYYNITSQNCQPIRFCKHDAHFYNYATNQCCEDQSCKEPAPSYIPDTIRSGFHTTSHEYSQMVCVNGEQVMKKIGQPVMCYCRLLWKSSYKFDMNGFPFYCDEVTQSPSLFFKGQLVYDQNKQIIKYGPFTAEQMKILLANMKNLQNSQNYEYTINQTQPILYAVNNYVPQQPIIRSYQYVFLFTFILISFLIFGASYNEYEKLRIKITESKIKKKIVQVLQQQNFIREIA